MKREDLVKLGLTEEALKTAGLDPKTVVDAIMTINGQDIEAKKDELAALQEQLNTVNGQLTDANTRIQDFEKLKPEELQAAVTEWKDRASKFEQDLAQAKKDSEARVAEVQYVTDLKAALKDTFNARDPNDIIPLLRRDNITRGEDGSFIGLKEQVEPLTQSKDYLFNSEKNDPQLVLGGKHVSVLTDKTISAARAAAGLPAEDAK